MFGRHVCPICRSPPAEVPQYSHWSPPAEVLDSFLLPLKDTHRVVVYSPLSTEMIPITSYYEITVELQVLGRKLTQFSFLTDRTEPGELRLRKV